MFGLILCFCYFMLLRYKSSRGLYSSSSSGEGGLVLGIAVFVGAVDLMMI